MASAVCGARQAETLHAEGCIRGSFFRTAPLQDLGIPSVQEAIAMSARDPLSTVLHYDVGIRVLLAWLTGIRM